MSDEDPEIPQPSYRDRIAILPGDPPIAYRPGVVLLDEAARDAISADEATPIFVVTDPDDEVIGDLPSFGQWYRLEGVEDAPRYVAELTRDGHNAQLDIVYFANDVDCCGCPPHPALTANPWSANPWSANPWSANPWSANPWSANPWSANPWSANAESLNLVATRKAPTSSVMPAPDRVLAVRPLPTAPTPVIGVLDSGLAGGRYNQDGMRPDLLGLDQLSLERIRGQLDVPSLPIGPYPADNYLDPVAGHGTFIAGIIEQLTPGCTMRVRRVFEPQGDVTVSTLAHHLWVLMESPDRPTIVNLSFGGTGHAGVLESLIDDYHEQHGVVFVGAAGNEGSCVEQYPAALRSVIGVAALGPTGPAPWSNYGKWVDACAPGTDIVSSFFAAFDGDTPPINGLDADDFTQWATWSGTSFAAPVVVAALAREMVTTGCTAGEAVDRVVRAPHLARLPNMGTIVNF
jgi:subtilisin family serine protease